MLRVELDEEEQTTLAHMLKNYRDDLWKEISHTDSLDFKETLRHRDQIVMQVLEKLGVETTAAAT